MALFGDVVAAMAGREPSSLRTQVHQGLVPLLLHLRDRCPAVATMTQSQEEFSIHLSQALSYLHSCSHRMRTWAALFLGYTTCYHTRALSQVVSDADLKLLLCSKQPLPPPGTGPPPWDGPHLGRGRAHWDGPHLGRGRAHSTRGSGGQPRPEVGGVGDGSPAGLEGGGGVAWAHPATHTAPHPGSRAPPPAQAGSPLTGPSSPRAFENLKKDREPGVRVFATSQSHFLQELAASRP